MQLWSAVVGWLNVLGLVQKSEVPRSPPSSRPYLAAMQSVLARGVKLVVTLPIASLFTRLNHDVSYMPVSCMKGNKPPNSLASLTMITGNSSADNRLRKIKQKTHSRSDYNDYIRSRNVTWFSRQQVQFAKCSPNHDIKRQRRIRCRRLPQFSKHLERKILQKCPRLILREKQF